MNTLNEGPRDLAFLLSEGNGSVSRDVRTIAAGAGVLAAGTVLGTITANGKFVASPNAEVEGLEGAEVARAILAYGVDATSADVQAVVIDGVGGVEVKGPMLLFHPSVDNTTKRNAKLAQLRAAGIKSR
ncbi:head decoration protein [Salinarimonas sp.]|uniref:head decoration protein n=1 Tax=Salinarimonas sp. TaxID=2766526 RepID=UPI003919613C